MRSVAVPFLVVGSFVATVRAGEGPAELQGRWELVSLESEGSAFPFDEDRPRWEIVGDRVRYGGEDLAVIAAVPEASPKSIDLNFTSTKRTLEGIYTREGDTLRICLNRRTEGVKERPHVLSTRNHDTWRLLTFRRAGGVEGTAPGFVGLVLGVDPAKKEVVVEDLLDDAPAAKAGLKRGDVLLAIDGAEVNDLPSAIRAVRAAKPSRMLPLRIRRDGEPKEIRVRVALMPFTLIADLE